MLLYNTACNFSLGRLTNRIYEDEIRCINKLSNPLTVLNESRSNNIMHTYLGQIWLFDMPIVTVEMYSGKTQREKDRLAEAITEDVVKILAVKKEEVVIVFSEAPHGNWYAGGIRL